MHNARRDVAYRIVHGAFPHPTGEYRWLGLLTVASPCPAAVTSMIVMTMELDTPLGQTTSENVRSRI
jgi:hypothetical protein